LISWNFAPLVFDVSIKAGIKEAGKRKMLKLSSIVDMHNFGAPAPMIPDGGDTPDRSLERMRVRKMQREGWWT
jgi:hypothetical protein